MTTVDAIRSVMAAHHDETMGGLRAERDRLLREIRKSRPTPPTVQTCACDDA